MQATLSLQIISTVEVHAVEQIDGGDTIVVRVHTADGGEAAMLIPVRQAIELAKRITDEAGKLTARGTTLIGSGR